MPVTRRSTARDRTQCDKYVKSLSTNHEDDAVKEDDQSSFNSAIYDGPLRRSERNKSMKGTYEETFDFSSPDDKKSKRKSTATGIQKKKMYLDSPVVQLEKINLPKKTPLRSIENDTQSTPSRNLRPRNKSPKKNLFRASSDRCLPKKNVNVSPTKVLRHDLANISINDSHDSNYHPPPSPESDEESSSSDDSVHSSSQYEEEDSPSPKKARSTRGPATPKKTPARRSHLMPSMTRRNSKILKPATPLQQARVKLHVSAVPSSLPCRGEEFNAVFNFLNGRLSDGAGGCIYVSGVPGTGKTATVNEAIRCLNVCVKNQDLEEFDYVDINGMRLSEPRQAYVQIYKQLTGESKSWEEAQNLLQKRFTKKSSNQKMTLILVDELDMLCNKRQDVIYNLLDWPSHGGAKLLVITIANTMDLPERCLMGRVTSRMGLTRLTFKPYTFKELEQIVNSRLEKTGGVFKSDAIQFVSRKVAAVSGDARRALDICRRSTEVAEKNNRDHVTLPDVNEALTEMIANIKVQAIKHCSLMEQLFLKAIVSEVNRTGIEEVIFKNAFRSLHDHAAFEGLRIPNISEALAICSRLSSWRLIICDHSKMDLFQRILLNVSADDVHYATLVVDKD